MHKIAIAIQKGGTGKTTTSLCLGGALALLGYKVLLIDMDPQANSSSSLVDTGQLETQTGVYELLTDNALKTESIIIPTSCGIDLLPANISLALAEQHLMNVINRERKLSRKLEELEKAAAKNPDLAYDFALIDCQPSLGLLTINALVAADSIIVPMQCEYYSERGFNDFLATMNEVKDEINPRLELMGVLLTMYNQTKTSRDVANNMREMLGPLGKIFDTTIARRTVLSEVGIKGPVQSYAPSSESAQEYNSLAQEVVNYAKK